VNASTRVVSWNDAAEMNESVESDAYLSQGNFAVGGLA